MPAESDFRALMRLIERLRGEDGCPWDRKQTSRSMAVYLVEELHELTAAIETGTPEEICEELGDVLFHLFFIARIYEEAGRFSIQDVARQVTEKMIRRHPHVFGDKRIDSADEVKKQWGRIKQEEKADNPPSSVLDSIPQSLPALMRAYRVAERAAGTGFDWEDLAGVMAKVEEEWQEFKAEVERHRPEHIALEFGDILFTLVNVARFARIHPETALNSSTRKFEARFREMEQQFARRQESLETASPEARETAWEEAKQKERQGPATGSPPA